MSQEIADNCPGSCEPQGACALPTTTPEPSDDTDLCCSNDREICDLEGPISTLQGNTCDVIKEQLANNGIEECPISLIYDSCPKMCGKCDCCANDLTKCDIGADEGVSCETAYTLSNGAACGAIGENCPKTCGLCVIPATITFELTVQGVTDDNKGEVCEAFATDLGGTVKHCDFSRSTRRLLTGASKLYVDIEFHDEVTTTAAETKVAQDNYLDSLTMPSGVTVTSMKEAQPTIDVSRWTAPEIEQGPGWTWNRLENPCEDSDDVQEPIAGCEDLAAKTPCTEEDTIRQCHTTCEKLNTPEGFQACTVEEITSLNFTIYADSACTEEHDENVGQALASVTLGTCQVNHLGEPAIFKCESKNNLVMETYNQQGCTDAMVSSTVVTHLSSGSPCWSYADLGAVFAQASWAGACQGTYESPENACPEADADGWRWRSTGNACSSYTAGQCSTLDWLETECPVLCGLCSIAPSIEDSADTAIFGTIGLVFGIIGMIVVCILLIWSMCVTQCLIDKSGWEDYGMSKSAGMSKRRYQIQFVKPVAGSIAGSI